MRAFIAFLSALLVLLHVADALVFQQHSFSRPIVRLAATPKKDSPVATSNGAKDPNKFTIGGLIQLVMMGAGAPSLGEYKRTDETGRMIFELEANNLTDKDGTSKQTKAKYFIDGYVEDSATEKAPGFWQNLASGGKLQTEWDERNRRK